MDSCWHLPAEDLAPEVKLFFSYTALERDTFFFTVFFQNKDWSQVTNYEISEYWILARLLASWWKSTLTKLFATSAQVW